MTIFITSDQHWGHANIMKYSNRPFESLGEHDAALIQAWNSVVEKNDLVYHLGDFTLGNAAHAIEIIQQLNGTIRVLEYPWHHDARWIKSSQLGGVERLVIEKPIVVLEHALQSGKMPLPAVLCHYPLEAWDRSHYGSVHFHGHTHGRLHRMPNRLDVGVDVAYQLLGAYRPFRLDEAIEIARSNAPAS